MASACGDPPPLATPASFVFPFTPYPSQVKFMAAVFETLEKGGLGVFESPTGTVSGARPARASFSFPHFLPRSSSPPCSPAQDLLPWFSLGLRLCVACTPKSPNSVCTSSGLSPARKSVGTDSPVPSIALIPSFRVCGVITWQGKSMSLICGSLTWMAAHETRIADAAAAAAAATAAIKAGMYAGVGREILFACFLPLILTMTCTTVLFSRAVFAAVQNRAYVSDPCGLRHHSFWCQVVGCAFRYMLTCAARLGGRHRHRRHGYVHTINQRWR